MQHKGALLRIQRTREVRPEMQNENARNTRVNHAKNTLSSKKMHRKDGIAARAFVCVCAPDFSCTSSDGLSIMLVHKAPWCRNALSHCDF